MSNDKRRLLAAFAAALFLLIAKSTERSAEKHAKKALPIFDITNSAVVDVYLDKMAREVEGEETFNGADIKVFSFYNPEINAYQFSVLQEIQSEQENPWYDIVDITFCDFLSPDTLSTMYDSGEYSSAVYEGFGTRNLGGSITTIRISNDEYDGYAEIISMSEDTNVMGEDSILNHYQAQSTFIRITQHGKIVTEDTKNLVLCNGNQYDNFSKNNFTFPDNGEYYVTLTKDRTYRKSQLDYLQGRLDMMTQFELMDNKDNSVLKH
ncbi:MAG: hypothetical protein K2J20_05170 [Bacilli bacterium]|nr:hypothetical protein [Bacilli bacterium]